MYHDAKTDPRPKNNNNNLIVAPAPVPQPRSFAAIQPPPENVIVKQIDLGPEVTAIFLISLYLCFALLPNRPGGFFFCPCSI